MRFIDNEKNIFLKKSPSFTFKHFLNSSTRMIPLDRATDKVAITDTKDNRRRKPSREGVEASLISRNALKRPSCLRKQLGSSYVISVSGFISYPMSNFQSFDSLLHISTTSILNIWICFGYWWMHKPSIQMYFFSKYGLSMFWLSLVILFYYFKMLKNCFTN